MKIFFIYSISLLLVVSCNEETKPEENLDAADDFNRTIKVNTFHVYNVSVPLDSILPDVQVEIYSNRENFVDRINPDATRTTDSTGYCVFENRNKEYYWIIAEDNLQGIITDSVSTPANTISYVELLFY